VDDMGFFNWAAPLVRLYGTVDERVDAVSGVADLPGCLFAEAYVLRSTT